jgi:hypothetical protein
MRLVISNKLSFGGLVITLTHLWLHEVSITTLVGITSPQDYFVASLVDA